MASPLDDIDHQILDALVSDGRMSMRTLAETLHISRANAYARVERLRTSGVIRGFRAEVDPELSGLGTSAYVTLNVRQAAWRQIAEQLQTLPGIVHIADAYHGVQRGWDDVKTALANIEEVIPFEGPDKIAAFFVEPVTE